MPQNNYPLSWFEQRIDSVIIRNNRQFKIKNKEDAVYCHSLQKDGFKFDDVPTFKVRIHTAPSCVACEG